MKVYSALFIKVVFAGGHDAESQDEKSCFLTVQINQTDQAS